MSDSVQEDSVEVSQVRPWVRFLARNFDYCLFFIPILVLFYTIVDPFYSIDQINDYIFAIIFCFLWCFIEAFCIAKWGATPGKFALNIRVLNADGIKLTYWKAFQRALWVLVMGEGLGIKVVTFITHLVSYFKLKNCSQTLWDERLGINVVHQKIGAKRFIIVICSFLLILLVAFAILFFFLILIEHFTPTSDC